MSFKVHSLDDPPSLGQNIVVCWRHSPDSYGRFLGTKGGRWIVDQGDKDGPSYLLRSAMIAWMPFSGVHCCECEAPIPEVDYLCRKCRHELG
jgi:hypothetical protein